MCGTAAAAAETLRILIVVVVAVVWCWPILVHVLKIRNQSAANPSSICLLEMDNNSTLDALTGNPDYDDGHNHIIRMTIASEAPYGSFSRAK